ncbi:MAG: hypothetical protein ACOWYE_03680 [Desulfatiglandales bacterium]
MKRLKAMPLLALLLGLALLVGCGEKAEEAAKEIGSKAQEATESAKEMGEKAQEATGAATEAAKEKMASAVDWTKDKIDAYMTETKEQLGKFDGQIDDLTAKAETLGGEAKEKFKGQLAALADKKEAVAAKMEELKGASGDAWVKAKQELDKLMADMKQHYENLKENLSMS